MISQVAQKTYIGSDGKKYCSICNQAGFMGPNDKWKCRSPKCQDKISAEAEKNLKGKNNSNIIADLFDKVFSISNPIVWILSRSIGLSMLIILFCFIGPYCSIGDPINEAQVRASARGLRENWVAAGACAFVSSIFIFSLIRSGIVDGFVGKKK